VLLGEGYFMDESEYCTCALSLFLCDFLLIDILLFSLRRKHLMEEKNERDRGRFIF